MCACLFFSGTGNEFTSILSVDGRKLEIVNVLMATWQVHKIFGWPEKKKNKTTTRNDYKCFSFICTVAVLFLVFLKNVRETGFYKQNKTSTYTFAHTHETNWIDARIRVINSRQTDRYKTSLFFFFFCITLIYRRQKIFVTSGYKHSQWKNT